MGDSAWKLLQPGKRSEAGQGLTRGWIRIIRDACEIGLIDALSSSHRSDARSRKREPSTGSGEGMASLVVNGQVGFGFDHYAGAISPDQIGSDQFSRARKGVPGEERERNRLVCLGHVAAAT